MLLAVTYVPIRLAIHDQPPQLATNYIRMKFIIIILDRAGGSGLAAPVLAGPVFS